MKKKDYKGLLLCNDAKSHPNTVKDHIHSFLNFSKYNIVKVDPYGLKNINMLNFDKYDFVIIHYTLAIIYDHFISDKLKSKLAKYKGLKIQFIQDDYRQISEYKKIIKFFNINVLYTLYSKENAEKVWVDSTNPNLHLISNLPGYAPENLFNFKNPLIEERTVDVFYRGRTLPGWLGSLGQDKINIGKKFIENSRNLNLSIDIKWDEGSRIYHDEWIKSLQSAKVMLGTESGSSITDYDGMIQKKCEEILKKNPNTTFSELYSQFLYNYDNNLILNTIPPKVFEAISLGTVLVLFEGEYSSIIKEWVHYIPLKKDFSNFDEVVDKIKDNKFLTKMSNQAYNDIIKSKKYSYENFIKNFDNDISSFISKKKPILKPTFLNHKLINTEIKIRKSIILLKTILILLKNKILKTIYFILNFIFSSIMKTIFYFRLFLFKSLFWRIVGYSIINSKLWKLKNLIMIIKELKILFLLLKFSKGNLIHSSRNLFYCDIKYNKNNSSIIFMTKPNSKMNYKIKNKEVDLSINDIYKLIFFKKIKFIKWSHCYPNQWILVSVLPRVFSDLLKAPSKNFNFKYLVNSSE